MMRLSLFNAGLLRQYEDVSCAKPGQQIPAEHAPCYDRIPIRGLDESTEVVHRPPPPFHGTRNHPVQGRDVPGHPEIITTISGKRKEASPVVSEMDPAAPPDQARRQEESEEPAGGRLSEPSAQRVETAVPQADIAGGHPTSGDAATQPTIARDERQESLAVGGSGGGTVVSLDATTDLLAPVDAPGTAG
ncbi:Uncharacterized protein PBTT_00882 [Plasmodiophora brassicae]|uniref:Uncharacterized protein n=1 Tax=Plasmodiophora brassicae TaxID=37360 RepID=A0A0G4IUK3_PLABS|nr:hypothetical protein PBRA_007031 [Plasmodiophora brassicae]SPQ92991.1 unnamed protein product [Plasmodiophora brassicae]